MRKKTLEEIKKADWISPGELSDLSGVRGSTIKYFTEIRLLRFSQAGPRMMKRYPVKESVKRLNEIARLKKKGKNIEEIILILQSVKGQKT